MIKFLKGSDKYYIEAMKCLEKSKMICCLAKTPTAFLSSQREKPWQMKFYNALTSILKNRKDIKIRYIFSLPLTKEELLKEDKNTALKDLEEWKMLANDSRIDFRYIDFIAPFSCFISDNHTLLLLIYPNKERACLVLSNKEVSFYKEYFDQLAKQANKNNNSVIDAIRKEVEKI
jgi:hypothetical protein